MTQAIAKTIIGPADDGRQMSLDDFEFAEVREGRRYELSRGVIVVTDVPSPSHGRVVSLLRRAIDKYWLDRPQVIREVFGSDCKLLVEPTQSERHPDLAVYKTAPPSDDATVWSFWVPEVVIEVVSKDSAHRDYVEKAEDYLICGIGEYWIVDPIKKSATIHRRARGRWQKTELAVGQKYSTPLLPGFELDLSAVLAG